MSTVQATFSELIQRPTATVDRMRHARDQGIRLTRRGDEDLYLTTARRAEQAAEVVDYTTRMFMALMKSDPTAVELLTRVFPEAFPWVRFLPEEDVRAFLVELIEVSRAAVELDSVAPIAQVITEWKHTAEVWADPQLAAALLRPSTGEDFGPVPEPPSDGPV